MVVAMEFLVARLFSGHRSLGWDCLLFCLLPTKMFVYPDGWAKGHCIFLLKFTPLAASKVFLKLFELILLVQLSTAAETALVNIYCLLLALAWVCSQKESFKVTFMVSQPQPRRGLWSSQSLNSVDRLNRQVKLFIF